MTIWFTSDTHWGHENVIKYCNRPFKSADKMDEALITRWNTKVKPEDTVYHTGDFAFLDAERIGKIIDRLNGNIYLIFGNHDKTIRNSFELRSKFVKCCDYLEIYVPDPTHERGKQFIVMCHYAMLVWNKAHHGAWMIHGHSHGTLKYPIDGQILDAGTDVHNYEPISYQEVKAIMATKTIQKVDHH